MPLLGGRPTAAGFWYVTVEARDEHGQPSQYALRVATADGTSGVRITRDSPGISRFASSGGWSPDSQHLAYSTEDGELFIALADGTNRAKLTDDYGAYSWFRWSPDSSRIAYSTRNDETEDYELFTARADGTNPTKLTDNYGIEGGFSWSPDSSRIAYGTRDDETEDYELFTARADGTNPTKLTDDYGISSGFSWSPDSSRIAYSARDDETPNDGPFERYELFTARADGTNPTKLTDNINRYGWSPDSSRIAYSTRTHETEDYEFFTARADGTNPTKLADDYVEDFVWSPDSSRIAYRTRDNPTEFYDPEGDWEWGFSAVRADGANTTQLVDDYVEDFVWSPESSRVAYITREHEERSADYDSGGTDTWPDRRLVMTVVDTDGGNSVPLGWVASFSQFGVHCFDITLAWQPNGIFFNVRPIAPSPWTGC